MKPLGLACSLLMLTGSMSAAQPSSSQDEAALRLLKTETWPRAYATSDPKLLDAILAPEFQLVGASGEVSSKTEELRFVTTKPVDSPDRRFRFEIERLDIFPNGTAVVTGTGHVEQPDARGGRDRFRYRSTNVLLKRDGRWRAIASHVSGVTPEAVRGG